MKRIFSQIDGNSVAVMPCITLNGGMETSFGLKLKGLREAKQLSQEELAEAVGTTQGQISRWERKGARPPKFENLLKLASALDANLDYLARGVTAPAQGSYARSTKLDVPTKGSVAMGLAKIGSSALRVETIQRIVPSGKGLVVHFNDGSPAYGVPEGDLQYWAKFVQSLPELTAESIQARSVGQSASPTPIEGDRIE